MGKQDKKKAGKRMKKAQLAELMMNLFQTKSSEVHNLKYIFAELNLNTHPLKMLCMDILYEMLSDDYISEVEKGKYKLNTRGTEMVGTFLRKSNGKNSFIPDGSEESIFVAERNSAHAMNGDRVRIAFYAKCKNRDAEGEVIEILERANT
ncbi:MAG: rnr, partial [Bacteroidetes bacterium]|nr:rnr [Bacteroidota bacterium]